jgi:pimeloyl-ACP methyl ester carboxylesterase
MKLLLRILLAIGLGLLALVAFVALAYRPEPLPEGSLSAQRLLPGPFAVADYEATFVDSSRPTPANGDFAGSSERVLEGQVWYPADGPEAPLLIFSHGFTSTYRNGRYLAEHLASHGFVVVAVDYPLTSMSAPGGPNVEDVVSQPGDVSFLIDSLSADSAQAGHPLNGRLDAARVGVFGISLGGLTSTLAGYHRDWRDPRIDAVLSIAGPTEFFTKGFFAGSDVPFLMLAGALDVLVPYEFNAAAVPEKVPGAELVTIEGGSHTGFSGGIVYFKWMENPDALGCWSVQRNVDAEAAESGWDGLLGGAEVGIDYGAPSRLCEVDPLPPAMNVLRQQMLAQLVIRAFFEKTLLADAARSEQAATFLAEQLPAELSEVRYRRSAL